MAKTKKSEVKGEVTSETIEETTDQYTQLAQWLMELKSYREMIPKMRKEVEGLMGYYDTHDEINAIKQALGVIDRNIDEVVAATEEAVDE